MTDQQKRDSNLGQLITAAKNHGIKFLMAPFENVEFRSRQSWNLHAWNRNNSYVNGDTCQPQDRGFLTNATEVFTDAQAIAAAKARIDFIIGTFESMDAIEVIACWELMEEMTWLATSQQFWGLDVWDNRMRANIREKMVPWVNEMATYIKAQQPGTLVGNAHAFLGRRAEFPADRDHQMNVVNEIHAADALDLVFINWYKGANLNACRAWLRECQAHFEGKQVLVTQYAPYPLGRSVPYQAETAPYPESKGHEWVHACGVPGFVGPQRWLGISESVPRVWQTGGIADPAMREIGGVTNEFSTHIDYRKWVGEGKNQDEMIRSPDMSLVSSWGDGQHVTMFCRWPTAGNKTITVDGLADQDYVFSLFDWITGELLSTQEVTAEQSRVVIRQVPARDGALAGYLAPANGEVKTVIRLIFRDMETNATSSIDLQADHNYELVTASVTPGEGSG
jgi:hypothetical protein